MNPSNILTQETIDKNKIEFDRVTQILNGQSFIISKIKSEIITLKQKYASMIEIFAYEPDQISESQMQLYDVQCQAFLHSLYMLIGFKSPSGNLYINPVTPESQETEVTLTLSLPNYEIQKTIASIDNISVDVSGWYVYFGSISVNISHSLGLEAQYDTVQEQPEPYFSKTEFLAGVGSEIEKLLLFNSQICRTEQVINGALRYLSELKNIGLYG